MRLVSDTTRSDGPRPTLFMRNDTRKGSREPRKKSFKVLPCLEVQRARGIALTSIMENEETSPCSRNTQTILARGCNPAHAQLTVLRNVPITPAYNNSSTALLSSHNPFWTNLGILILHFSVSNHHSDADGGSNSPSLCLPHGRAVHYLPRGMERHAFQL